VAGSSGEEEFVMADQVRLDNIDRVFTVFDTDGDGQITWDDFQTKAAGIGREFGLGHKSTEVQGLAEAYRQVWDYIRGADVDTDGAVTAAEFRQAHASGRLTTEELLQKWRAAADRVFEIADRDGDGRIDEREFAGIYRGAGITDPKVAAIAFAAMDVDSNGRLDREELFAQVRGVFTATDDSAKGAHMLSGR
jgi:Ca2+-binding EF-hand superfamily protein